MFDYSVLQVIWWVLVIVLLSGFVILDGFDLGVLALNPFISKTDLERRVVINTVAPHWDGNQVWLLLGGGALFAAWPEVYATAFSGFFLGMILILAALYFRPVGFEYRNKFESEKARRRVDFLLFITGVVPALVIGVALGNALQGVPFYFDTVGRSFYGDYDSWFVMNLLRLLNPFALLTGIISLVVFLLQGSAWLCLRTKRDSALYARSKTVTVYLSIVLLVLFVIATVWLVFIPGYQVIHAEDILQTRPGDVVRSGTWFFNYNNHLYLYIVPVIAFLSYAMAFKTAKCDKNVLTFIFTSVGVITTFTTFAISLFPLILPSSVNPYQSLTIWNATSSQLTLQVMFYVAIVFVPIVLLYTIWCYWKMWQRLSPEHIEAETHHLY